MVAIKIQSKEDIIGAYLCSLGFAGRELPSRCTGRPCAELFCRQQ